MSNSLATKLASLRHLAPKINEATDEAAATIAEVDAFLAGLGIGVSGRARFATRNEDSPDVPGVTLGVYSYLQYERFRGKFQVHIGEDTWILDASGEDDRFTTTQPIAWSETPREVKLESFAVLPELLDNIERNAREKAEKADRAMGLIRDAMGSESPAEPPVQQVKVLNGKEATKPSAKAIRAYVERKDGSFVANPRAPKS